MKKIDNRLIILLIAIIAILLLVVVGPKISKKFEEPSKPPLKIAFIGDLSSQFDKDSLLGVQIAVDEFNKAPNDRKIGLEVYDSKKNNGSIGEAFSQAVGEGDALAVISTFSKSQIQAPLHKTPTIYLTKDQIIANTDGRFNYGIQLGYIHQDSVLSGLEAIIGNGSVKTAVLITDTVPWSQSMYVRSIERSLPQMGIPYDNLSFAKDPSGFIARLRSMNPDMVILGTNSENTLTLLEEMKRQGYEPSRVVIGFPSFHPLDPFLDVNIPKTYFQRYVTDSPPVGESTPTTLQWFSEKIRESSGQPLVSSAHLNAYDAGELLSSIAAASVADSASVPQSREAIRQALWDTRHHESLRGYLTADGKTGYLKREYYRISLIENGTSTLLTNHQRFMEVTA